MGGPVVMAPGAGPARAVPSACLLAADLARGEITEKITQRFGPGRSAGRGGHFLRRPLRGALLVGGLLATSGGVFNAARGGGGTASPWVASFPTRVLRVWRVEPLRLCLA